MTEIHSYSLFIRIGYMNRKIEESDRFGVISAFLCERVQKKNCGAGFGTHNSCRWPPTSRARWWNNANVVNHSGLLLHRCPWKGHLSHIYALFLSAQVYISSWNVASLPLLPHHPSTFIWPHKRDPPYHLSPIPFFCLHPKKKAHPFHILVLLHVCTDLK